MKVYHLLPEKFYLMVLIACIGFNIESFSPAWAMEPPRPGEIQKLKKEGRFQNNLEFASRINNHKTDPFLFMKAKQRILELQGIKSFTPPPAWQGMPTTGNVRVFALLIEFQDYTNTVPATTIDSMLYGTGNNSHYPRESLTSYYGRSSYGLLDLSDGSSLGWYKTAYNRSSVLKTTSGRQNLIKEVLNHYDSLGHDFSRYDNDGDGDIDYFIVIWTGPDTGWGSFWWGYQTGWTDRTYRLDGKTLGKYSWQWESDNPTVIIHETGHALGLPDYYDYNASVGPDGGVGGFDMMHANKWDHNCFSKWLLDWITPTVVAGGSQNITLDDTAQDAVLIWPGIGLGDIFSEYYMVQNRQDIENDNDGWFNADGLVIWHIDATLNDAGTDFKYNNSFTGHKLIRLMEADGLEEIERGNGWAEGDDLYTAGDEIGPDTALSSDKYDGTDSCVRVWNISDLDTVPGAEISATFSTVCNQQCTDIDSDGYAIEGGGCGPVDCDDTDPDIAPGATEVCDGVDNDCDGIVDFGIIDDFDINMGNWKNAGGDDIDWILRSGSTPSSGTGPSCDHTSCGGNYMYIEASSPNYPNKAAYLESDDIDLSAFPHPQLSFWHHMNGTSMSSLHVDIYSGGVWNNGIWSISGNRGEDWNSQVIDMSAYAGNIIRIRFRGITGNSWSGDIAIDDVLISENESCDGVDNNCDGQVDEGCSSCTDSDGDGYALEGGGCGPVDCDGTDPGINPGAAEVCDGVDNDCDGIVDFGIRDDFDIDMGSWKNVGGDNVDWILRSGSTPSSGTGPSCDHTSCGGYYMYIEASNPNYPDKTAYLESVDIDLGEFSSPGLHFWHHMKGASMGSLHVDVYSGGAWNNGIWSISGNRGEDWNRQVIDMSAYAGNIIRIRFRGVTGNSWSSDIAIDDVIISEYETCDGVDNNCDGQVDEGCSSCTDNDGDGYALEGGGCGPVDCQDTDPGINPGATEVCDGVDNDCDGIVDFGIRDDFDIGPGNWKNIAGGDDIDWTARRGSTPSYGTGPSCDYTSCSGYYMYMEASNPNYPDKTAFLESVDIDLGAFSNPGLHFWHHMKGASMGSLHVDVYSGGAWNNGIWSISGNRGEDWNRQVIDMSAYAGNIIRIRFRGITGISWSSDIAIDDVIIAEQEACSGVNN